jgi:hypothetical protein
MDSNAQLLPAMSVLWLGVVGKVWYGKQCFKSDAVERLKKQCDGR